jgi:hypothetical protein
MEKARSHKRLSTIAHFRFTLFAIMSPSKDTVKAIVIILLSLGVLCALLLVANHVRPHP